MIALPPANCDQCGKPLPAGRSPRRRFCNYRCRNARNRRRYHALGRERRERRNANQVCRWCDRPFSGKRRRKYCGPKCQAFARRALDSQRRAARQRRYYARKIAAGLCPYCTEPLVPGRKACARHLAEKRRSWHRHGKRWRPPRKAGAAPTPEQIAATEAAIRAENLAELGADFDPTED